MSQFNVLICERFSTEALMQLKSCSVIHVENFSEEKLSSAHALIIRSKFKINKELLAKAPQLKLVVTCTSGYDHIDLVETGKRNIQVMYTPEANVVSTAELTWSLIMMANRNLASANKDLKAGTWNRDAYISHELAHRSLGIIGLGRIGSRVAKIAKAFQMNVLAFDPYRSDDKSFADAGATRASYEEVLRQVDILSFHVPLTRETKNMFNRSHADYITPDLILINASRGSVVNEEDLAEMLNTQKIKFAALDVFAKEPLTRDSKLLKCKNILLTPHLGAFTEEAFLKASLEAASLTRNYFENNQLKNTLPLQNEWGSLSFTERT